MPLIAFIMHALIGDGHFRNLLTLMSIDLINIEFTEAPIINGEMSSVVWHRISYKVYSGHDVEHTTKRK